MARKPIPKKIRKQVYAKYNGHCAYCGCELAYKDMQVDHIESVERAFWMGKEADNSINNYNPACRQCNFYKSTYPLEMFRENITKTMIPNLQKNFNYRLAIKYGFVEEKEIKPVVFYFEKQQ